MHISRLHIDRFGILSEQEVPGLSPGLTLFLGNNEAGKSTCLWFFQSMLFGYKRGNRSLDPMPDQGKKQQGGGTLFLRSRTLGPLLLTRRPGVHGGALSLFGAGPEERGKAVIPAGEEEQIFTQPLGEADLRHLLGNLTVDVFDKIFAFSLKDLMDIASLRGDSVRHALHGAVFGTGLKSPAQVFKSLDERMSVLLKRNASSSAVINRLLHGLAEVRGALADAEPDMDGYVRLRERLGEVSSRLEELRNRQKSLSERQRHVQETLNLFSLRDERLAALQEADEEMDLLRAGIFDLDVPQGLAEMRPAVQSLREQKERRCGEAENLPVLVRQRAALAELQEETLQRLGPGWNADKIATADLSIASRDRILEFDASLAAGKDRVQDSERDCARFKEGLAEARRLEDNARTQADQCRLPECPMPEAAFVTELEKKLALARTSLAALPRLREREQRAAADAARALADIDPAWTNDDLIGCDVSLRARQRLEELREGVEQSREVRMDALRNRALAQEEAARQEAVVREAEEQLAQYGNVPDIEQLDGRYSLLRRLERLLPELDAAGRTFETADKALAEHLVRMCPPGQNSLSVWLRSPLILLGVLFATAGLGLAGTGYANGLPLLWNAGLGVGGLGLLACLMQVGLFSGAFRRLRAEEDVLRQTREKAEAVRAALADDVAALMEQNAFWLNPSRPSEPDEADLARAARVLERQGRTHILLEKERRDLVTVRQVLAGARNTLERRTQKEQQAREAYDAALRRWREHLHGMRISAGMRPEQSAALFDRIIAAGSLAAAAGEASQTRGDACRNIETCLKAASTHAFFAQALSVAVGEAKDDMEVLAEAEDVFREEGWEAGLARLEEALAALRGYEKKAQERRRRLAVLEERREAGQRLEDRLAEAERALGMSRAALEAERSAWAQWLEAYGLAAGLSPKGVAEALDNMRLFLERSREASACKAQQERIVRGARHFAGETVRLARQAGVRLPEILCFLPGGDADRSLSGAEEASWTPERTPLVVHAAAQVLDNLAAVVEEAVRAKALRAEKEERLAARGHSRARLEAALRETEKELEEMCRAAANPKEGENALPTPLEAPDREEDAVSEEAVASPSGHVGRETLADEAARLREEAALLESEAASLSEERGKVGAALEAKASSLGNAPLRQREAALCDELHGHSRSWMALALARELLLSAKARFEREGRQGVIQYAGEIFSTMTGGEYTGIVPSLDADAFVAQHRSGDLRDPEKQFSQGTREQLYLALRLAYVRNHATKAEPLPVIMDDILVNFDPERTANTAAGLADFARENQILFFTCHPGTAETLLAAAGKVARERGGPEPVAFRIQRGAISSW